MLRGGLVESGLKLFVFRPDRFCHSLREAFRGILLRREVRVRAVDDTLLLYRIRDVPVPFSVLGLWELHAHLCARLNHRHLSFVALELWEPGVALPRQRQRSCGCTGFEAT